MSGIIAVSIVSAFLFGAALSIVSLMLNLRDSVIRAAISLMAISWVIGSAYFIFILWGIVL